MDTWSTWEKRTQNEPKTNPIYPGVASGEAGSKPISYGVLTHGKNEIQILEFSQQN